MRRYLRLSASEADDLADDVVQDVCLRILGGIKSFDQPRLIQRLAVCGRQECRDRHAAQASQVYGARTRSSPLCPSPRSIGGISGSRAVNRSHPHPALRLPFIARLSLTLFLLCEAIAFPQLLRGHRGRGPDSPNPILEPPSSRAHASTSSKMLRGPAKS